MSDVSTNESERSITSSTTTADRLDVLVSKAAQFADELTTKLRGVFDTDARFAAEVLKNDQGGKTNIAVTTPDRSYIPLCIQGKDRLEVMIKYHCCFDRDRLHLAVDESWFHVRGKDRGKADRDPLLRIEYVRDNRSWEGPPAAHAHIHAHRDEFFHWMFQAKRHGSIIKKWEVPRLSKFHLPNGGTRFRPSLEDFLQMLIYEFNVDARSGGAMSSGTAERSSAVPRFGLSYAMPQARPLTF